MLSNPSLKYQGSCYSNLMNLIVSKLKNKIIIKIIIVIIRIIIIIIIIIIKECL